MIVKVDPVFLKTMSVHMVHDHEAKRSLAPILRD